MATGCWLSMASCWLAKGVMPACSGWPSRPRLSSQYGKRLTTRLRHQRWRESGSSLLANQALRMPCGSPANTGWIHKRPCRKRRARLTPHCLQMQTILIWSFFAALPLCTPAQRQSGSSGAAVAVPDGDQRTVRVRSMRLSHSASLSKSAWVSGLAASQPSGN